MSGAAPRGLVGLAAATVLLLAGAPGARAQVTIAPQGGSPVTLDEAEIRAAQDVDERRYTIRSAPGSSTTITASGTSLAALFEAADLDRVAVGYVELMRPDGSPLLLSRNQALDDDAFEDGPPIVSVDGSGVSFLRPSAGPDDVNAADRFASPALTLRLRRGSPLEVSAQASPAQVDPGEPVTLTASVEGAGAGEGVETTWLFDDGGRGSGERVVHRFRTGGSYQVLATVTAPGNRTGSSDVVVVQVGPRNAGPDRRGGGRDPRAEAPDSGPGEGAGSGSGRSAAADSPGDAVGLGEDGEPSPRDEARERSRDRPEADPDDGGERVEGELLADAARTPPPPPAGAAARGARTGRERDDAPSLPPAAWGGLATLLLAGMGAALELRPPRRRAPA